MLLKSLKYFLSLAILGLFEDEAAWKQLVIITSNNQKRQPSSNSLWKHYFKLFKEMVELELYFFFYYFRKLSD